MGGTKYRWQVCPIDSVSPLCCYWISVDFKMFLWFKSLSRNQLLVCLLKMSRENLGVMPKVVGIDVVEMALWAQVHIEILVFACNYCLNLLTACIPMQKNAKPLAIGAPSAASQTEDGRSVSAVEDSMQVTQQDFVSKAEEEDMEALLGR